MYLCMYVLFSFERYPFRIPSIEKWYPFNIPSLELCISQLATASALSLKYECVPNH